jgi:hypothetical protein
VGSSATVLPVTDASSSSVLTVSGGAAIAKKPVLYDVCGSSAFKDSLNPNGSDELVINMSPSSVMHSSNPSSCISASQHHGVSKTLASAGSLSDINHTAAAVSRTYFCYLLLYAIEDR